MSLGLLLAGSAMDTFPASLRMTLRSI